MSFESAFRSLLSRYDIEDPHTLERFVAVFSLLSLVGITLLVGISLHFIYRDHTIRNAESNAIKMGYVVFEREKGLLVGQDERGRPVLAVGDSSIPLLDKRIRLYLEPLNIVKIKFFDPGKKVVYSSDPSIIGKVDLDNASLAKALEGDVTSKIVKKGSMLDLAGETRFDVDVVETYFPVTTADNRKIGAFETYSDVSRSYAEIRTVSLRSMVVLFGVLFVVFGTLLFAVHKLTKRLVAVQSELERSSITDHLTQVYNRGYVIKRAEEELKKVQRQAAVSGAACVGFILLDIDDFKEINDRFGHLTGDAVLREIASRLKQSVREYDVVGRFGGEEFLVMLPNTSAEKARSTAERIWNRLRDVPVDVSGDHHRVTASFGVACYAGQDENVHQVLQKADEKMYQAKREGKDRIVA